MKVKIFSGLLPVASLAILSVAALANTAGKVEEDTASKHIVVSEATVVADIPEISSAPQAAEKAEDPTEETEPEIYKSMIASMDWDAEESYLLAKIAMAEAEGEDTEGKALVILVVLNRVWGEGFPNSIKEVIYQPGQFSPISNGRFDRGEPDEDCWAALDLIMMDKWDKSYGATYFESESESTWHSENLDFLFQHGNHFFYKDRER